MNWKVLLFVIVMVLVGISVFADAAVLCSNPSGVVSVRVQCIGNEQQLDPVTLGLVGISGYELVTHQEFLEPGTHTAVYVECPTGKKVLGGGFSTETDEVKVTASQPSDGQGNFIDHGWNVFAQNTGSLRVRQTVVSAICALVK